MFIFTVLGRGIGTRETKANTIGGKEAEELVVVKLATIVTLKAFYVDQELSLHKLMKLCKQMEDLRLVLDRKDP